MKRSQFLASLLGVVAAPFVAKEVLAKEEEKCPFNVELLQKRLDYLKSNPPRKACLNYLQTFRDSYKVTEEQEMVADRFLLNFELGLFDIKKV